MLIFNTTFLVSDDVLDIWLDWVYVQHIPFMLKFKPFSHPQVAKVITSEQEGTSFSVQFHINNMETLKIWNEKYGVTFKDNFAKKFGTEAIFFSTVLELVQQS